MQQLVRVLRLIDQEHAEVFIQRQSACSGDCHKCSGCGAATETVQAIALNPIHAQPGELVYIEAENRRLFAAIVAVYCLPLLLFFLGYFLGETLAVTPALLGGLLFILGVILAIRYDRYVARHRPVTYRISGYP